MKNLSDDESIPVDRPDLQHDCSTGSGRKTIVTVDSAHR